MSHAPVWGRNCKIRLERSDWNPEKSQAIGRLKGDSIADLGTLETQRDLTYGPALDSGLNSPEVQM